MLPNKVAAFTFVGFFLLALVPAPASAQTQGADLAVTGIDYGNAVNGTQTTVRIIVKNIGNEVFTSQTGWQVFIGWNGYAEDDCIDTTANNAIARKTAVCYQRVSASDGRSTILPGNEVIFEFPWTPTQSQVTQIGPGAPTDFITTDISSLGNQDGGTIDPDDNADNDRDTWIAFIRDPKVRAFSNRQPTNDPADSSPETRWDWRHVTADCEPSPTITLVACRPNPGMVVAFSYRVKNEGNSQDAFTGQVIDPHTGQQVLLTRGYTFHFSPELVTLQPNQTANVTLIIFVPENETAGAGINNRTDPSVVTARWRSALNTAVHTDSCNGCDDPTLPTLLAKVRRGTYVESNETWAVLDPKQVFEYNVRVNNTGNAPDRYSIEWDRAGSTINDSWLPIASSPISLNPGETGNLTLSIQPQDNTTNGHYRVAAKVRTENDPNAAAVPVIWTAELRPRYNLSGGGLTTFIRVVPDEVATYSLYVKNNGNAPTNVTARLEASGNANGWERHLSATEFTVPPFSEYPLTLTAKPPVNTVNNTEAAFFVNVTSRDPSNATEDARAKTSIRVLLNVLRGSNIRAEIPNPSQFVHPSASATYTIRVTNTGNVFDNFSIRNEPPAAGWAIQVTPRSLPLNPTEAGVVTVVLTAPTVADVGETTRVFMNVESSIDASRRQPLNITARISGPDLFIESLDLGTQHVYTGDVVPLSIVVGNRGNIAPTGPVTLRVEYVLNGVPRAVADDVTFNASDFGPGVRTPHVIPWNTTGIEEAVILRARIDPDRTIPEIEESASSNEATLSVSVRGFDIRVDAPAGLEAHPNEQIVYDVPNAFVVRNLGSAAERVRIVIESENGWGRAVFDEEIQPHGTLPLRVVLNVPAVPGVAKDTLRLTLTPAFRPSDVKVSTVDTIIVDERAPVIADVAVTPETATVGEDVRISARVTDETGVREVRAHVVPPGAENTTQVLALQSEGNGVFAATTSFNVAGTFRYYIAAVDNSGAGNTATTADVLRTFRLAPGTVPDIRLGANQSTTIRTGTPILLAITDPVGIKQVNYTIRGLTEDLAFPFERIDTSSLTAGEINLVISAENLLGGTATRSFTIRIDNTPPIIRTVTIAPDAPKVNEDVTVRVETDADATAVNVTVKRGDQIVGTYAANRTAAGIWELVINPGDGAHTIDVTATDAAGNPRVMTRAAEFTAKPDSFLPGFEAAILLLVGLGAAAWARRRRT